MLIALDIDGTILNWDEELSPRVAKAITAVKDAGHQVVLATGRSILGTAPVARQLGLDTGWLVCSNGAVTGRIDPGLDDGFELTDVLTFAPARVLRLLQERLPDAFYFVECPDVRTRLASGPIPDGELMGPVVQVPFEQLVETEAVRVVVRSLNHTIEEFDEIVRSAGLHEVAYAIGWTPWLDIAPDGVSKASALEEVRRRLGVDLSQTLAVGDGTNDLEMFAWAARSVAMGQSQEVVKRAAGEVTGSVTDDGLAAVLEGLV